MSYHRSAPLSPRRPAEERLIDVALQESKQRLSIIDAKVLLRTWLFVIADAVRGGSKVEVPGFGIFYGKTSKPRRIRSVRTGELVSLPRTRRLGFRAAGAQKWSDA